MISAAFASKAGIVGSHEVTQPMRLQPVAPPDASDAHVPEAEFACQTTAAPVSAPIIWGCAASTPALWPPERPHWLWPYARGAGRQGRSSVFGRTDWSNAAHTKCCTPEPRRSRARSSRRTPQDDIGTPRILGTHAARTQPATKFTTFRRTQHQTFGCHPAIIANA